MDISLNVKDDVGTKCLTSRGSKLSQNCKTNFCSSLMRSWQFSSSGGMIWYLKSDDHRIVDQMIKKCWIRCIFFSYLTLVVWQYLNHRCWKKCYSSRLCSINSICLLFCFSAMALTHATAAEMLQKKTDFFMSLILSLFTIWLTYLM